jgi:hypothetical protein
MLTSVAGSDSTAGSAAAICGAVFSMRASGLEFE